MAAAGKQVLVVDDEPGLADLVADYLRRIADGMSVTTATSATDALSHLRGDPEFDCVVSDYNMPEMNGLELLEAVREEYPSLPFVLYTGRGSEEIASEAISAGVTDYLQKESGTDHYEVLANRIENAISQHRTENELHRTHRKIEALHETAARAAVSTDRTELAELAVEAAEEILAFDICDLSLAEGSRLVPQAVSKGVPSDGYYRATPIDADDNLAARVYRDGESRRINDLRSAGVAPAESDYRSALTVPIDDHGVFQAVSRDVDGFDDRDFELAELLLAHVGAALDRIESEERLRDERDKFAALFHNIPHAVGVGAFEDGDPRIVEANPTFEEVFGWDEAVLSGRSIDDLIVPDTEGAESEAAEINRRMRDGEHVSGREVRRNTADGPRDFLLHTVRAPNEDADGFVIYTDITEQKRRERELQRQNEHLDEFVSVLSRDVQDALDVAHDSADGLRGGDDERQTGDDEAAERIRTALTRIEARIEEALDLAEQGRTVGEQSSVPLPTAVEAAWESVETGDAALSVADPPAEVSVDPSRLRRLFEGLFRTLAGGERSERDGHDDPAEQDARDARDDRGDPTVEVGGLDDGEGLYVAAAADPDPDVGLRAASDLARPHGWSMTVADSDRQSSGVDADGLRVELHFDALDPDYSSFSRT